MAERERVAPDDGEHGERLRGHDPGREYGTVALVAVCIGALVLAAALLPALAALGPGGAPAEWLVPVPPQAAASAAGDGGSATTSQFGALSPGDSQAVGGTARENGTFRSLDTAVHFTVRSETPAYWRTGAYDTYTGDGWERSAPSDASAPTTGESVRYEVTLNQSAASPPTVWHPVSVDGPGDLAVTESGVATSETPLPAGTTYAGLSEAPPRDPSVLRASGESSPPDVRERYTALPDETAAAVGPVAANVTANASSPYETAVSVEEWLESTKDYSLDVPPPEDDVAAQFVTEMDAGYCEYFATSMVAMLRSQGVPSRYVVGYSTGDRVSDDTYRVRAMNAHAWVEVYVADVGWVRFDPTPGADRIDRQRQRLRNESDADYDPPVAGSPGDWNGTSPTTPTTPTTPPTPDTPTTPSNSTTRTTPARPTPTTPTVPRAPVNTTYDFTLNETAVPGAVVEVSVTAGGLPVPGARVQFNGEAVGRTGSQGTLVATVPYAESLHATATGGRVPASTDDQQSRNASRTIDLETNGTLAVSGDRRTGGTVTLTAAVADVPLRNGTVFVDGQRVGRTDERGRATVRLPGEPGNATVRVERGPVTATTTVELDALNASVDPVLPLPIAGTPVEVTAFVGGEPAAGVPVHVGDERVGTTDLNGTITATLPPGSSVPVVVTYGDQTARATVSNPLVNLLGLVGVALASVVGTAAWMRLRGLAVRDLPRAVPAALFRSLRTLVSLLVGGAVAVGLALSLAGRRGRATVSHLRALASGEATPAELATAFREWAAALPGRAASAVAATLPARLAGLGRGEGPPATADGPRVTIREAWGRFLDHVSVSDPGRRTPGQLAAHAIAEDDLPADAVATLRDEFRAVEYGPRDPGAAVPTVASAVETIEETVAAREAETDATGETETDASPREAGGED